MSLKPRLLLDLDGVVADFVRGVYEDILHEPVPADVNWNFVSKEAWQKMDYEFWTLLERTPEFASICDWVATTFGWENTCVLSSPVDTLGCVEGKRKWVLRNLPQVENRMLFGSAKEFAAGPATVLLDDQLGNVQAFEKAGGIGLLLPRGWNPLRELPVEETLQHYARILPGRIDRNLAALARSVRNPDPETCLSPL